MSPESLSLDEYLARGHSLPEGFDPSEWDEVEYFEDVVVAVRGDEIVVFGHLAQQMAKVAQRRGMPFEKAMHQALSGHVFRWAIAQPRVESRLRERRERRASRTVGGRGDPSPGGDDPQTNRLT